MFSNLYETTIMILHANLIQENWTMKYNFENMSYLLGLFKIYIAIRVIRSRHKEEQDLI